MEALKTNKRGRRDGDRAALDKKNIARLTVEQRKVLVQELRDKKKVGQISRKASPVRVPCPLMPGSPEVPPPRIPQSELEKSVLEANEHSRVELVGEGSTTPPPPQENQFTPLRGVIALDEGQEVDENLLVDTSIDLIGFSPSTSFCAERPTLPNFSPGASSSPTKPEMEEAKTNKRGRRGGDRAALDKKNMARLTVEQRARVLELRDRKEIGRFLMPDAPPRKNRRKVSPVRVPCPLMPGTPEVPPPRIPQRWELKKSALDASGPSSVELVGEGSATPPPPMENQFTPFTGVIVLDEGQEVDTNLLVDASIDLIGFSPSTSFFAEHPTLPNFSPEPSTSSTRPEMEAAKTNKKGRRGGTRAALDKKNMAQLTVEQRARVRKLRDRKEVGQFLMPDAPPKKKRRKASPVRVSGTLEVSPPRIPKRRELKKSEMEAGKTSKTGRRGGDRAALDKKNMARLTVEQRARVQELRDREEIGRFLMPDAPPRKNRRKVSPVRVSGTLEVSPPRIPKRRELKKSEMEAGKTSKTGRRGGDRAALDKKNMARLTVEQRARVQELRDREEVGQFLMPDSPPRKNRRKASPVIVPCPLMPGTPEVQPPRIPQRWELKKSALDASGPSGVELVGEGSATPPPSKENQFTPLTGVIVLDEGQEVDENLLVYTSIDSIVFSPSTSFSAQHPTLPNFSPGPSTSSTRPEPSIVEDEIAAWEQCTAEIPGSDEEADLPDVDAGIEIPQQRYLEEYPAELDSLTPDLLDQINALDARDDSALREYVSSEDMLHFNWQNDASCFTGEREAFTSSSGPTFATDGLTPLDILERIWDETIINLIVAETNRYANQLLINPNLTPKSRMKEWKDIQSADLWAFFGILMLQSFIPNPVEKDYWHPRFPYLQVGNLKDTMSYNKFLLIKKCLHFVDNSTIETNSKLSKISPIIDHLNRKFSCLYLPGQNIAIDESLLLWKGRLTFVQLISNKAARVGIKSYELCESRTGYLWKFEIYTGKEFHNKSIEEHDVERVPNEPEGATSQIVYRLVRPLLNKGHTLFMDNFYNSPLLSRTLKAQKTDTVGTLRLNREFVPDSLRDKANTNMRVGEIVFSHTEDLSIVLWRDANLVSLISTYHKVEVGGKEKFGNYKYKPKVVLDYNLSMGGVDKKDQLLQAFPMERIRNMVWYKKLFRRLLNVSIHNAYIIYSHTKKIPHREFRMMLADEILRKHCPPRVKPAKELMAYGHFPIKSTGKARCKHCAKDNIESRTVWACDTCGTRLCITCFRDYHIAQRNVILFENR